ncbi:hypothetical protein [Mesorhizobium sp.]|uniref:hypothetical protein n=3 Tax=Mesorhizobium sp. TaxID=1871066 RepID=UPI000FE2B5B2|nr:hypothetical protein [Mesorhizobium sp.]
MGTRPFRSRRTNDPFETPEICTVFQPLIPTLAEASFRESSMPSFRFEVIAGGQSNMIKEDLASVELASPRAVELAKGAASTASPDADHSGSRVKVYDAAGYLIATVNFSDVFGGGPLGQTEPLNEEPGVKRSG